jgi:acetylglutamate kinase
MSISLEAAAGYIYELRHSAVVVKIGGSTLGSGDTTLADLATLQKLGIDVVVVHGGGAEITGWLKRIGKEPVFVRGLRVTDKETLDVAVMALAGKVNKQLVAGIMASGGLAVGICGADAALLQCSIQKKELGLVGKINNVEPVIIKHLMAGGLIPVIAPIGFDADHPENGQLLNINADTAAGEIAAELEADQLVFLTDVPGIMDENKQVIPELDAKTAKKLIKSGVISKGMIPKAEACLRMAEAEGRSLIVDGREPGALLRALLTPDPGGTVIG